MDPHLTHPSDGTLDVLRTGSQDHDRSHGSELLDLVEDVGEEWPAREVGQELATPPIAETGSCAGGQDDHTEN